MNWLAKTYLVLNFKIKDYLLGRWILIDKTIRLQAFLSAQNLA